MIIKKLNVGFMEFIILTSVFEIFHNKKYCFLLIPNVLRFFVLDVGNSTVGGGFFTMQSRQDMGVGW